MGQGPLFGTDDRPLVFKPGLLAKPAPGNKTRVVCVCVRARVCVSAQRARNPLREIKLLRYFSSEDTIETARARERERERAGGRARARARARERERERERV